MKRFPATRAWVLALTAAVASVVPLALTPALSSAAPVYTCSGTLGNPGVLAGDYYGDVEVSGVCAVDAGQATVHGSLIVARGGALLAAFGLNHRTGQGGSALTVTGNLRVRTGGTALVGCLPTSFPCIDDPNPNDPTLSSADRVGRNIIVRDALGVVVHDTTIGGDVSQIGGGGGFTCVPEGIFAAFGSPVYSTYEDSTVGGSLSMIGLHSCWAGTARVNIAGNATYLGIKLADRDGIEIVSNHIDGNLTCRDNSMVWDSGEIPQNGALFPRRPQPNSVEGTRSGQCVYSSPTTEGGPLGTTPF